jgi:L-threonylcarbamoyladenylate synthase
MALDHDIEKAASLLQAGDVVAMPTETVYGLAASIASEAGLRKIFAIKERPFFDPLIVHIATWVEKDRVVSQWPAAAEYLAKAFWPGPLTFVLPKHRSINPLITSGLETVAVRMPAHPTARALIEATGSPLAAPSANKFGKTSPTKADHVRRGFADENLFVLDGGSAEVGLESTVIRFNLHEGKTVVEILRPGGVTQEQLEECLQKWGEPFVLARAESNASPGHGEHHYMPNIPLLIIDQESSTLKQNLRDRICEDFLLEKNVRGVELWLDQNPKIAARALYQKMREASDSGASFLYVIRKSAQIGGLWEAIWDRLSRAASRTYSG